jgi:hypothetical protein
VTSRIAGTLGTGCTIWSRMGLLVTHCSAYEIMFGENRNPRLCAAICGQAHLRRQHHRDWHRLALAHYAPLGPSPVAVTIGLRSTRDDATLARSFRNE